MTHTRAQADATRGQCIMLGVDTNYPRRTFRVRDLTTGQVIMRQAIIWHPTADAGEAVSRNTATKGGKRRDTGVTRCDPRKPPTACLHWGAWRPSRRSRNRNNISREGRVGRKVRLHWREWSMRRGELLGRRGQLRRWLNLKKRLCQSRKRMNRETTRPMTRVSRN